MMEIDTVYENVSHNGGLDTCGLQIQDRNKDKEKAKRERICFLLMMVSLGLICVVLLVFVIWQNITSRGDSNLIFMSNEEKSWSESRQFCRDHGGDLVMIKTEEKQKFLSAFVEDVVWIGLTDIENEGVMKWIDGSPLTPSQNFFLDGEPNNLGHEDCVIMNYFSKSLKSWNDTPCNYTYKVICEK